MGNKSKNLSSKQKKKNNKNNKSNKLLLKSKSKKKNIKKTKGGNVNCAVKPNIDSTPCFYIDAWKQYKSPCKFLPLDGPNQLTNIFPENWDGNLNPR